MLLLRRGASRCLLARRQFSATTALPSFDELKLSRPADNVLLVELNRPYRLHALSETLGESLMSLAGAIDTGELKESRVVVLTGAPCSKLGDARAFSTGRDLKLSAEHTTAAQRDYYMACALESVLRWRRISLPTIASIEGPAFGWGAELALACDLRVVSADATICFPETSLGLFPGAAGAVLLPSLLPPHRAKEVIFSARRYRGHEVHEELGLTNRCVDEGASTLEASLKLASSIAQNAPLGLAGAKAVIGTAVDTSMGEALELSRRLRPPLSLTDDYREALRAFAEKRSPVFQGK